METDTIEFFETTPPEDDNTAEIVGGTDPTPGEFPYQVRWTSHSDPATADDFAANTGTDDGFDYLV